MHTLKKKTERTRNEMDLVISTARDETILHIKRTSHSRKAKTSEDGHNA